MVESLPLDTPDVWRDALGIARSLTDGQFRAPALMAIGKLLPVADQQPIFGEALEAARSVGNDFVKLHAILDVAKHSEMHKEVAILEEAADLALSITHLPDRVTALLDVASQLPTMQRAALVEAAVKSARTIADEASRVPALIALAAELPVSERSQVVVHALNAVENVPSTRSQAEALTAVLALSSSDQVATFSAIRNLAISIDDEKRRIEVLCSIAERLSEFDQQDVLTRVTDDIQLIRNEETRSKAISVAARCFSTLRPGQLHALLDDARAMVRGPDRVFALVSVAEYVLPAARHGVLIEILDAIEAMSDEDARLNSLRVLTKHISEEAPEFARRCLGIIRLTSDPRSRSAALLEVAKALPLWEQTALLNESLRSARGIGDPRGRAFALAAVAEALPVSDQPNVVAEAFAAARMTEDEGLQVQTMLELAVRFLPISPSILDEVLAIARGIPNDGIRPGVLCLVAEHMAVADRIAVLFETFEDAKNIPDDDDREYALYAVAQSVPTEAPSLFEAVLEELPYVTSEHRCANALLALSRRIPVDHPGLRLRILEIALQLPYQEETGHIIGNVASDWAAASRVAGSTETALLADTLLAFAHVGRSELVGILRALTPLIKRLGGEIAVRGTADAIMDTAEWWP